MVKDSEQTQKFIALLEEHQCLVDFVVIVTREYGVTVTDYLYKARKNEWVYGIRGFVPVLIWLDKWDHIDHLWRKICGEQTEETGCSSIW